MLISRVATRFPAKQFWHTVSDFEKPQFPQTKRSAEAKSRRSSFPNQGGRMPASCCQPCAITGQRRCMLGFFEGQADYLFSSETLKRSAYAFSLNERGEVPMDELCSPSITKRQHPIETCI
jgi:hypothetical protein